MAWSKNYLLAFDTGGGDGNLRHSARGVARRYNIPSSHLYAYDHGGTFDHSTKGFQSFSPDCMSDSDADTKLFMCGHGGKSGFGVYLPAQLADFIVKCGITTIGMIAFKGCKFGAAAGLTDLGTALIERKVSFGYLSAYKSDMWYAGKGRYRPGFFQNCFPGGKVFLDANNRGETVRVIRGPLDAKLPSIKHLALAEDIVFDTDDL